MNPQPYQTPPQWWPSHLNERFIRWWRYVRQRELRAQKILEIESSGAKRVRELVDQNAGVLIASNHSFHYDTYTLIEAGLRAGWTAHFMTAWQVFGLTNWIGKFLLQQHGCFSINREGTDTKAFRHAVSLLSNSPHPLVVLPEGDIYHSNDMVMPFREGVASIALAAGKRAARPIYVVPCAMKVFYVQDPTQELTAMMGKLEAHIGWRPQTGVGLVERIYRFGNGYLSLKEVEYLGQPQQGSIPERIRNLADAVLRLVREQHGFRQRGKHLSEQIKNVRGDLIKCMEAVYKEFSSVSDDMPKLSEAGQVQLQALQASMDDMFFVTQLSSYRGNYTLQKPTLERMAETIDKFEEDVFSLQYPTPRGTRKVIVTFGEPIDVKELSSNSAEVTALIETRVQDLLDAINATR